MTTVEREMPIIQVASKTLRIDCEHELGVQRILDYPSMNVRYTCPSCNKIAQFAKIKRGENVDVFVHNRGPILIKNGKRV